MHGTDNTMVYTLSKMIFNSLLAIKRPIVAALRPKTFRRDRTTLASFL